jgi:hypothetical protein
MRHAASLLTAALLLSTALPASAAGGRARAREAAREERRDDIQEKRDERRDAAKAKATPGANKRQRRQGSAIVGGVKSGQLTEAEAKDLSARDAGLRRLEASMKADGTMTRSEREALHSELDALARAIRSEKHDADATAPLRRRDGTDGAAAATRGRRLVEVRRSLNRAALSATERAALEAEHATLVDGLFEEDLGDD